MVGVSAVIVRLRRSEVLLIQRGQPPGRGRWSFPGGLVETGEMLHQACVREVLEETNLEVQLVDLVKIVQRVEPDPRGAVEYHYVIIDFWGTATGGELEAGSDVLDARWVTLDGARQLPTTPGVVRVAERALQLAAGQPTTSPVCENR